MPLILGWPICFVLIAGVVLWALAKANGGTLPSPLPAATTQAGLNFLHLWFLYLLLWLYAITIALRAVLGIIDRQGAIRGLIDWALGALVSSPLGPVLLAAPVAVALFFYQGMECRDGRADPRLHLGTAGGLALHLLLCVRDGLGVRPAAWFAE